MHWNTIRVRGQRTKTLRTQRYMRSAPTLQPHLEGLRVGVPRPRVDTKTIRLTICLQRRPQTEVSCSLLALALQLPSAHLIAKLATFMLMRKLWGRAWPLYHNVCCVHKAPCRELGDIDVGVDINYSHRHGTSLAKQFLGVGGFSMCDSRSTPVQGTSLMPAYLFAACGK